VNQGLKDIITSNLRQVVRFEKKKILLPLILVLVLTVSVFYGLELRDNQELDKKHMDAQLEQMTELTIISIESQYYPDTSELRTKSEIEEASKDIGKRADRKAKISSSKYIPVVPAIFSIESPLIPLTASSTIIYGKPRQSLLFGLENGYVVSRENLETFSELQYRKGKFEELRREINENNMSYQEFQQKVKDIRSVEYKDEELRNYTFDNSSVIENYSYTKDLAGYLPQKKLRNNDFREIQFYHFIPSLAATFIVYYLLTGLILTGLRDFKSDVEEFSKRGNFFRNNLILSALASTLTAALILLLSQGI